MNLLLLIVLWTIAITLACLTCLVFLLFTVTLKLVMRTNELNASVASLATSVSGLDTSVQGVEAALRNRGAVTPDADVDTAITNITTQTAAVAALKQRLDTALAG